MECQPNSRAKGCGCSAQEIHQPFPPRSTKLGKNMNRSLAQFKRISLKKDGEVYAYLLTTIRRTAKNGLRQEGSAPNFQGNCITLCTCKHRMRTWRDQSDWKKGVWIAGLTNLGTVKPEYGLFYLMRVGDAFESHFDLWNARYSLKDEYGMTLQAKVAHRHFLGDIFFPKSSPLLGRDRFLPENYLRPKEEGHSHSQRRNPNQWHKDVRRAYLLVGDPKLSFIWDKPELRLKKDRHARTKKYRSVAEFLEAFKSLKS